MRIIFLKLKEIIIQVYRSLEKNNFPPKPYPGTSRVTERSVGDGIRDQSRPRGS
jgi:hypothetical protein